MSVGSAIAANHGHWYYYNIMGVYSGAVLFKPDNFKIVDPQLPEFPPSMGNYD